MSFSFSYSVPTYRSRYTFEPHHECFSVNYFEFQATKIAFARSFGFLLLKHFRLFAQPKRRKKSCWHHFISFDLIAIAGWRLTRISQSAKSFVSFAIWKQMYSNLTRRVYFECYAKLKFQIIRISLAMIFNIFNSTEMNSSATSSLSIGIAICWISSEDVRN